MHDEQSYRSTNNSEKAPLILHFLKVLLLFIVASLCMVLARILFQGEDVITGLADLDINKTISLKSETAMQRTNFSRIPQSVQNEDYDTRWKPQRLLYIVTSSSDQNNLRRMHMMHHKRDRIATMMIPVLKEGIESLIEAGYSVDLVLICKYILSPEKHDQILQSLPKGVKLEFWDDATPIDYDLGGRSRNNPLEVIEINRALARQHRYVVRDKLWDYDMFLAFEDDMLITAQHVQHHLYLSEKMEQMKIQAPDRLSMRAYGLDSLDLWFGHMKKDQFDRIRPGFVRVEVMLNHSRETQTENEMETGVPLDYKFGDLDGYSDNKDEYVDPSYCCYVRHVGNSGRTAPFAPNASELMIWETGIAGLGVRQMPDGSWVMMLPGPRQFLNDTYDYKVGKFLAGQSRPLKNRPLVSSPKFIAQSAGWMMTRRQLLEMHVKLCKGSFLPPFDGPTFLKDGLYMHNVEYWSGGLQQWCPKDGCNIQRIVQLDPKNFSKHLLYHTANNKQFSIARERQVRANHLFGQLNTVRKDAIEAKNRTLSRRKSFTLF